MALTWCCLGLLPLLAEGAFLPKAGFRSGLHSVQVRSDDLLRRYMVYVPTHYNHTDPVPLWILAHGTDDTPEIFIEMTRITALAEKYTFAFAALAAIDGSFNVGLDARVDDPAGPDDVGYAMTVLREVTGKLNVDMQRIRCAGFSRGARFCSRLGSELSSFITGVAMVSGIRFPIPNNATRPLPIIAFHGTKDKINPYNGEGNDYWKSSVDDAVQRWAKFNGCTQHRWVRVSLQVFKSTHTGCKDGADVVLIQIKGGGHTWPGSLYDFGHLGYVTQEIDASTALRDFFVAHPMPARCHTAVKGEPCHAALMSAMHEGIEKHPDLYKGLTNESSVEDFQKLLHRRIEANCAWPCRPYHVWLEQDRHAVDTAASSRSQSVAFMAALGVTAVAVASLAFRWARQEPRSTNETLCGSIRPSDNMLGSTRPSPWDGARVCRMADAGQTSVD